MNRVADIRILHVDDDPAFTDLTADMLERTDGQFTVETATSASEGLDRLADGEFDCLVSDYDMPGTDGIELLETVRERYPTLPYILFTGEGSEDIASEALRKGATDYLQKRGSTEQYEVLVTRIRNGVDRYETERSRRRWKRAIETATQGVAIVSEDGEFLQTNGAYASAYDESPAALVGTNWRQWYADDEIARFEAEILPALREEGTWEGESVGRRADATAFDQYLSLSRLDGGGHVCVMEDITERKRRERELAESRERYRSLFENNPLVIWEEDLSETKAAVDALAAECQDVEAYLTEHPNELGRLLETVEIVDVNQNAVDYYEAPSKEALLDGLDKVFTDEAEETFASMLAAIADGATQFRSETVGQTLTGDRRAELFFLYVPDSHAETYSRVYIIGADFTQYKERELELRRERDRLDEFAGLLSHDLRNPLNVATARLELASQDCESEHLADAAEALDRMEILISDLLTVAREGTDVEDTQTVYLGKASGECWGTVQTGSATLVNDAEQLIRADPSRLKELLENLVRNAVDHGGPEVTVTVGDLDDGFYVADDGPGIPDEDREAVFQAGYTTAQDGTGLGLAIVEELAGAHGWAVRVTESDGGGARFEITDVETVN